MDKYKTDPQYATTYMEIPQRDEGSESSTPTKPVSPSNFQKNGERTPSGEDLRHNHDIHTPPEKDVGPGKDKAPAEAPMAFTVDLGDDIGGAPKLNMRHSLSEFLPHKVRKSFRSRSIKSRRNSEDKEESMRDGSPVSQLHTGSPSYHSDGGHPSTHSSDNEDISIRSDTVTTKTKKSSTSPRIHSVSRGSRREKQQMFSQKTSIRKTSELRKQQTSLTSTTDSTNYLIERMFNQPSGGRSRAPVSITTDSVDDSSGFVTYDDVPSIERPPSDGVSSSKHSRASCTVPQPQISGGEPSCATGTLRPFDRQGSLSDNISESGTYTIESENQGSDLQKARESIDAVFGVEETVQEADIRLDKALKSHVSDFTTRPKRFTKTRQKLTHGDSMDVEVGSGVEPDDNEEPEAVVTSSDTPKWVNQWATVATQKTFVKTTASSTTLEGYGEGVDVQSSSESTNGLPHDKVTPPRRRHGTGRKLPTPPVKSSSTTPISPRSTTTGQSSEFFSPRDSILSETPEKELELKQKQSEQQPESTEQCFIDPRPDNYILSDILPGGVTSDVVTFVHDDMSESVFTDMTESMTSSKMTESLVEENQEDNEQEIEELTTNIRSEQCHDVNVRRSIDTDILLRDTADAVQAIAERVKNNIEQREEAKVAVRQQRKSTELFIPLHDDDTDSDGSARAFVNGHRDMPKLKPKPNLQRHRSKDTTTKQSRPFLSREERELEQGGPVKERSSVSRDIRSSTRSSPKPKPAPQPKTTTTKPSSSTKSAHKVQPPKVPKDATFIKGESNKTGRHGLPALDLSNSFCSDIQSESESVVSTSTECSGTMSPRLDRKGSKGKGPMSLTRPNRAFALRRARLESEEQEAAKKSQTGTPRSRPSSAGARETLRSRPNSAGAIDNSRSRPLSARDTSSTRRTDSNIKSVNRGRDRSAGPPRAKSAGPQTDYSRMTARHEKKPLTSQTRRSGGPPSSSSSRSKSERISVNNISLSGSRSKPTSRSNSPQIANQKRSDEYSAWKRRKSYDPRQAVVNAKAKAKDGRLKNTPERSLSAGPHSRAETFSSVSSEDTSYGIDDLQNYPDLDDQDDPISQASSAVSHQMEAMSRSIESDTSFSDTKLSYDSVMVNSIYQLSLKVKSQTDKILEKMRDQSQLNGSPSPTDDMCSPTLEREIPGYKNANQELIGILRNLRSTERHLRDLDRVLFPGRDSGASPGSPKNHEHYLRELERIRNEISGFRPIDNPTPVVPTTKTKSPVTRNKSPWRRTRQPSREFHADPLASDEYF